MTEIKPQKPLKPTELAEAYPRQSRLLYEALRVAAGLPRELPPVDLFKRERVCRLVA